MEKVTKFIIITVLQKIWILIYGIKSSVFLDADTNISEMRPISIVLWPKHGILPREVGLYLPIHGAIHFPGDQTLNKHRPCQNSRGYSPSSHRQGLGSIPGGFFLNKLTLGQVQIEYNDFPLSVIFQQCYMFIFIYLIIYLLNQSFIHLPVTLYNLSEWQRRWVTHCKKTDTIVKTLNFTFTKLKELSLFTISVMARIGKSHIVSFN